MLIHLLDLDKAKRIKHILLIKILKNFEDVLVGSRTYKKLILKTADFLIFVSAIWSSFALRLSVIWDDYFMTESLILFIIIPLAGVVIFNALGVYQTVIRFMSLHLLLSTAIGIAILSGIFSFLTLVFDIGRVPRSVPIIFGITSLLYISVSRLIIKSLCLSFSAQFSEGEKVLIFGAGKAGAQLVSMLQNSGEYRPIGFIDENEFLSKTTVSGLRVHHFSDLDNLVVSESIATIILAIPSANEKNRKRIIQELVARGLKVFTLPSILELLSGETLNRLRPIDVADLLGRREIKSDKQLIRDSISGKSICITGAGGSIGSELARQAVMAEPRYIILYDISEFLLYQIDYELSNCIIEKNLATELIPILGSVLDSQRFQQILFKYSVTTVFHTAAYKHVPLVEQNVIQGISNNVLGTRIVAIASRAAKVEKFILVSTDKAVRSTNVMGATKRLAELVIQNLADEGTGETIFATVRFGNVLGSSGSVIPLFKNQIECGGPVTVTHPDVTRYFMTISEAASLVIAASSLAIGGEIFVLDMGQPVKIVDLAKAMIQLNGLSIKDETNPDGDIAISFSGLRSGEKLYEELSDTGILTKSRHPKIRLAQENNRSEGGMDLILKEAQSIVASGDAIAGRNFLLKTVSDFNPSSVNIDSLL